MPEIGNTRDYEHTRRPVAGVPAASGISYKLFAVYPAEFIKFL